MPMQTGHNIRVAYKQETTFGTPPGVVTGATQFRPNAGAGLALSEATVNSGEIRSDLLVTMARMGSHDVKGSYAGDLSVGTFDPLFQAVMRGAWSSVLVGSATDFTSVTQTANSIVAASGSFLTKGFMTGDVIQINVTGGPAANNNRNLRITSVSATTLGIAETLIVDATGRTTFTITRTKKLVQPVVPIRQSFTFEEYFQDIGLSSQFVGCRVSAMKLSGKPNGMVTCEFSIVGADLIPLSGGASPFYTAPVLTSTIGLVMTDATLRYGGSDVVNLTAFDFSVDLKAATQPIVGSKITPDVFDNNAMVTGSISAIRSDLSKLGQFTSETEFQFQALMVEPTSEPKNFVNLFIPRCKLTGVSKAFGQDGPMIETLPFTVGAQSAATGLDATMFTMQTSAA